MNNWEALLILPGFAALVAVVYGIDLHQSRTLIQKWAVRNEYQVLRIRQVFAGGPFDTLRDHGHVFRLTLLDARRGDGLWSAWCLVGKGEAEVILAGPETEALSEQKRR